MDYQASTSRETSWCGLTRKATAIRLRTSSARTMYVVWFTWLGAASTSSSTHENLFISYPFVSGHHGAIISWPRWSAQFFLCWACCARLFRASVSVIWSLTTYLLEAFLLQPQPPYKHPSSDPVWEPLHTSILQSSHGVRKHTSCVWTALYTPMKYR